MTVATVVGWVLAGRGVGGHHGAGARRLQGPGDGRRAADSDGDERWSDRRRLHDQDALGRED